MNRKFLNSRLRILTTVTLIVLSLSAVPLMIPTVRATGILYIDPAVQQAQPAGSTVTYQVKVANMPSFSSWEMAVKVNQTALNPVKIDISGNVLTANYSLGVTELINCVNESGVGCSFIDNPGVVHSGVSAVGGSPPPGLLISGLLFTITFTAGSLNLSSILLFNYGFSLAGNDVPHSAYTTVNAIYGNGKLPVADFTWTPRFPFIGGNVTFDASASSDPNPKAVINNYFWDFQDPAGTLSSSNPIQQHAFGKCISACLNPNGNQSLVFAVTLTVTDNLTISNSKTLIIAVNPRPGFSFLFTSFFGFGEVIQGGSATANLSLSSEFGFSGDVALSAHVFPEMTQPNLPIVSIDPVQVELKPGGVNSSILTVNTSSATSPGLYDLQVVGTSGSSAASISASFRVQAKDFGISIFPDQLSIVRGSTGSAFVEVVSLFGFSGTVSLTSDTFTCFGSSGPVGLTVSLGTSSVVLVPNSTVGLVLTISTTGRTPLSICDNHLIGTSGTLIHPGSFGVEVLSPKSPDFSVSTSPPSILVPKGTTRASTITLTGMHGFSSSVILGAFASCGSCTGKINVTVSPSRVLLSPDGTADVTLTVSASTSSPSGKYFIVVVMFGEGPFPVEHSAIVEVRVPPPS